MRSLESDKMYLSGDKLDIWSLGVIAFQALTGTLPYDFGDLEVYCKTYQMVFENTQ